ncbi:glycerophosphoryl diester phosphodiesterase membrane domain-containing protein [Quadrisphaera sp. DSM 44207]|uniref:glycerophosphoryl diester phosphodiesterase membrane domain-containing protein n=1 Tax=Quadrisphaera sp. DSM 44207 TaxID=1881057 RepID=UPI00088429A4|nr:glycerophosphoryl diester phosphodiesterase membrane domain-containing protein [Quadrisphaera sp. DSM 44207]SDQ09059.1 Membrane domain of glycerophosphoryl diester phosphodiesterase [Quadrisphaera sp. DSM 44207]
MSDAHGWAAPSGEPAGTPPPPAQPPAGPPLQPPGALGTPGAPGTPGGAQAAGWGAPPGWTDVGLPLKPGIVPLRPLSALEVYDGAFQAVRTAPGAMLGAAAVVVTVLYAIQTAFEVLSAQSLAPLAVDPESVESVAELSGALTTTTVSTLVTAVTELLATTLLAGVATVAVSTAVLGRRIPFGELWQRVRPRLPALLGAAVLTVLLVVAVALVCLLPGILLLVPAFTGADDGLLATGVVLLVLGGLAALAAALFAGTRLALTTPAVVLEGQPVLGGMRRSWALTRRGFWRVLGVLVLANVVMMITTTLIVAPFSVLGLVLAGAVADPSSTASALAALVPPAVGAVLASTVLYPLTAAITALLYIDQRMRLEGLDVELARAATSA